MTENLPDAVNYLQVRADGSYGLTAVGDLGPINIMRVEPRNPGIVFRIGPKRLAFRLNDEGKIDAEYEPEDLTEAAQAVVDEIRRILNPPATPPGYWYDKDGNGERS